MGCTDSSDFPRYAKIILRNRTPLPIRFTSSLPDFPAYEDGMLMRGESYKLSIPLSSFKAGENTIMVTMQDDAQHSYTFILDRLVKHLDVTLKLFGPGPFKKTVKANLTMEDYAQVREFAAELMKIPLQVIPMSSSWQYNVLKFSDEKGWPQARHQFPNGYVLEANCDPHSGTFTCLTFDPDGALKDECVLEELDEVIAKIESFSKNDQTVEGI